MDLSIALEKSRRWMILCSSIVDGANFVASDRTRVVASLHHLCIEHHSGIILLCDNGVHGSAFALHRPQFEAYIRGAWLHHCADDQQIQKFLDGNDPPKVDDMIRRLETLESFNGGLLSTAKVRQPPRTKKTRDCPINRQPLARSTTWRGVRHEQF